MDNREENSHPQFALREPLFEASDVPAFTSTSKYELSRCQLVRFFRAQDPPPHEYRCALLQVLFSFKDPAIRARTQGLDVDALILPDWVTTFTAFLAALDARFQSPTILEDTRREWIMCKPRKHEDPFHFLLRFDGATNMLVHIQKRLGIPPESNVMIIDRLLQVLPRHVVDYARLTFLSQRPPVMTELQTFDELRPKFEIAWKYLPKPHISEDRRSVYARNTTANRPRNNVFAANKINPPQCNNIVCSSSTLPVPKIIHDRKLIFCPATLDWSVPELIQVCPECKDFLLHGCARNNERLDVPRSHGPAEPCHHFHLVFIDGACTNNGKPTAKAGVGIAYGDDVGSRLSIPITDTEDNFPLRSKQRAELCAARFGLDLVVKTRSEKCDSEAEVWIIATDSEYVVKGMTKWLPTWKENGWRTSKGTKPANLDLFLALNGMITAHEARNVKIGFWHIPREHNKLADRLAKAAALHGDEAMMKADARY